MAYTVNNFDGTLIATVEDGTIDNTTNLRFIGKNYAGYGEVLNENQNSESSLLEVLNVMITKIQSCHKQKY